MFRQDFTCPALLEDLISLSTRTGLSPAMARPFQTVPVLKRRPLAWSAFARHY
jgi:hypothetical protein